MTPPDPLLSPGRRTLASRLRNYLIAGLLALAPTAVTLWVLVKLFNVVDKLLGQYLKFDVFGGERVPGLGLAATLALLLLVGWAVSVLGGMLGLRSLIANWEYFMSRIPGAGILYGSTKSIGEALATHHRQAFQKVVLVPWPSPGIYRIGFIASEAAPDVREKLGDVEVVFVPHSPNPASGFVHYVPRSSIVYLDWPVEEGLRVVVSGGVVQPHAHAGPAPPHAHAATVPPPAGASRIPGA